MAKIFTGFTPEQLGKIDPILDGVDSDTQQQIIAANPALSARLGKMATTAQQRLMSQGGLATGYAKGGTPKKKQSAASKMTSAITADPKKLVQKASVSASTGGKKTLIKSGTGTAKTSTAGTTVATKGPQAKVIGKTGAATYGSVKAAPGVDRVMAGTQAAQGQVSQQAQVQAAQGDPTQLSQLGLQAAQGQAATVQGAPTRTVEAGEMVSGSTVDQSQVQQIFGTQPLEAASVADEMAGLMQDFDKGQTPAWAAGAMRAATQQLAARGIGASSIAGMATVQAAMEAALPIAQMDAANKQEVAIESARQRAAFLNMEFDQNFQTKVINAAKISEIANMNFTAQQQVALENARMAQTMNLANLDNRQAKVMADAAAMTQMDMANLDNRQQAAVQNAQSFLAMDMSNLDRAQQMSIFKAQERANALLSDQAAENAERQFNASSKNQTNQFFASLSTGISQFNSEQEAARRRFNAGEKNALAQFNASQRNQTAQFNAQNKLIIAQANAQWFQSITTAKNAAKNQANRDAVLAANNLTMTAYNNLVQRERDTLAWAWQSAENEAQRDANIAIAKITQGKKTGSSSSSAWGSFLGQLAINAADYIFQ